MALALRGVFLVTFLFSVAGWASPQLENISNEDFENVIRDLSGIFAHTTVSSAALYSPLARFEVGFLLGSAETPHVNQISQESDPDADISMIPHASLIGIFYMTEELRFELNYLPQIKSGDFQLSSQSFAVQYTATDPTKPGLDFALKFYFSGSDLRFTQTTSGQEMKLRFNSNVTGLLLVFSQKVLILEPYFAIGRINTYGMLKSAGSGTIFDTSYTTSNRAEESVTGNHLLYGVNFDIFALQAGVEISRAFNADKISAKFSFNL